MKKCCKCLNVKNYEEFNKRRRHKDGLEYYCKSCSKIYEKTKKERRRSNPNAPKRVVSSKKSQEQRDGINKRIRSLRVRFALNEISEDIFNFKMARYDHKLKEISINNKKRSVRRSYQKQSRKERKERKNEKKNKKKLLPTRVQPLKKILNKTNNLLMDTKNKGERKRRAINPIHKMSCNLRHRTNMAVKKGSFTKQSSLNQYLGCTMKEFKTHIESLFQPGMTWDNYGSGCDKWHLDHIIPLASAISISDLYTLCHYTNLQPLWEGLNALKSDMMPDEWEVYKKEKKIA